MKFAEGLVFCAPGLQQYFDSGLFPSLPFSIPPLSASSTPVQVSTCPYSIYGAWVGGSILCSLSTFKDMWVTNAEYKDIGSSIVGRRSL